MKLFNLFALLLASSPLFSISLGKATLLKAEEESGISFQSIQTNYICNETIAEKIVTFEATIKLPSTASANGGVIWGASTNTGSAIIYDICGNGRPRITLRNEDGSTVSKTFASVDLRNDEKAQTMSIVNDYENKKLYCYVDGELKQTVEKEIEPTVTTAIPMLGGDKPKNTYTYFNGELFDIALFDNVRDSDQIKKDFESIDNNDFSIIAHYDLRGKGEYQAIFSESGDNYAFFSPAEWINPEAKKPLKPYAYSMAVIGDIQYVTRKHPEYLHNIFDYLIDNQESLKLKYVLSMGDTCDQDSHGQWTLAREQYARLDGKIPYAMVRGNHDSAMQFNKYFNTPEYRDTCDGWYSIDRIENSYRLVTIGSVKYVIITIDYGPSDSVLSWAGEILDMYPDYQGIVITHCYLNGEGVRQSKTDVDSPQGEGYPNGGEEIWDKLVSKHSNIKFMMGGHYSCNDLLTNEVYGDAGNKLVELLADPQGFDVYADVPTGMIGMLYFSEDGSFVQTEYYSTIREKYYGYHNMKQIHLYDGKDYDVTSRFKTTIDDNNATVAYEKDSYNVGDIVKFNITPKYGYEVESVTVNNETAGYISTNSYFFEAELKNYVNVKLKVVENVETQIPEYVSSTPTLLIVGIATAFVAISFSAVLFVLKSKSKI